MIIFENYLENILQIIEVVYYNILYYDCRQ